MGKLNKILTVTAIATMGMSAQVGVGAVQATEIMLPKTVVWTAYNTGTSGYNQAVGIGSVLKNAYGINLRVLPGKNDVSRLSPLRNNVAQFSATGSDSVYAQEAVYTFGTKAWGPQPIRLLLHNLADGCAVSLATAKDANIKTLNDLKGKRVAWVRGAPALNQAVKSMLAFANLTWDDVKKVEVGGYGASVDGLINNDLDAFLGATFSSSMLKVEASPRGLYHPSTPHSDDKAWSRLNSIVPWYARHRCMQGAGVPSDGYEGIATAYPILISTTKVENDVTYNMTKAMYNHFDDYKASAPGANGWAWERQKLETVFLPFHEGAVKYYMEVGKWSDKAQANQDKNLKRQQTIIEAWKAYSTSAPTEKEAFKTGWMKARAEALTSANMDPVFLSW